MQEDRKLHKPKSDLIVLHMSLVHRCKTVVSQLNADRGQDRTRTRNHSVVTLVRLEGNLFKRLELSFPELLNLRREDGLRRHCGVDTASLDGNKHMATILEEVLGVVDDNTSLVRLGNISKDDIDY